MTLAISILASKRQQRFTRREWLTVAQNGWGCTEAMAAGIVNGDNEDWPYVYFDTVHTGVEFRKSDAEFFDENGSQKDLYEIVLTMTEDTAPYASWHVRQGITPENTKPPFPEYRPGDLFTPHPDPTKSKFVFKFVGRTDDTFTLSTASNIVSTTLLLLLSPQSSRSELSQNVSL